MRAAMAAVLFDRELEQLVAEGRVKVVRETPRAGEYLVPGTPDGCASKWFQDSGTGEIYEYREAWERGGARFDKINLDERYKLSPKPRPI
jgi:hypothetical protein